MSNQVNSLKKGLTVKDLVTTGIFSAIFFVFTLVGGLPFAPNPVLTFYMPMGAALLCGPIYLLMVAKDRNAPPFLHLGHHQQIDGAAQQGRPHGHIKGQNRVRSEWKSTDQGKHKENGAEYARSHQVLDS